MKPLEFLVVLVLCLLLAVAVAVFVVTTSNRSDHHRANKCHELGGVVIHRRSDSVCVKAVEGWL